MKKFLPFLLIFAIYFLTKFLLSLPLQVKDGTVIKMGAYIDSAIHHGKLPVLYPIVAFKIDNNTLDTTTDTDPGSFFHTYIVGDNVRVCYKPNHPESARLYSFFTWWLPIGNLGALVLACIAWIGISRIFSKKLND